MIKSMTFYYREQSLVIFEGTKKIYIPQHNISPKRIKVSLNAIDWDQMELNGAVQAARQKGNLYDIPLYGVYYLHWGESMVTWHTIVCKVNIFSPHSDCNYKKTQLGAFFILKKRIVVFDIYNPTLPDQMFGSQNLHPELTLVHDQVDIKISKGFIIHRG